MRRLKLFASVLLVGVCLTGCGSSGGSPASNGAGIAMDSAVNTKSSVNGLSSVDSLYSYDNSYSESADYSGSDTDIEEMQVSDGKQEDIKPEMLVYSGDMTLATKEYEKTISAINAVVEKYGAFIENSNFSKSSGGSYYRSYDDDYYNDEVGLRTYQAKIRVKSQYFEEMVQGFQDTAKVTFLNTNIENLTMEYTDLVSAIDLYSAKRDRYLKQYEQANSDSAAIAIERELTDIELKLAQYEARKRNIETDVAYSYIDLRVEEKRPYEQSSSYSSSFGERLKNQVVNTGLNFLEFCEGLLFWLIAVFPYLIIFGVVIFIVVKISKKTKLKDKFKSKPYVPDNRQVNTQQFSQMNQQVDDSTDKKE